MSKVTDLIGKDDWPNVVSDGYMDITSEEDWGMFSGEFTSSEHKGI